MAFPYAADGSFLLRGLGALFFKRSLTAGVAGAGSHRFLGNCTKIEVSMNDERLTVNSAVEAATPPLVDIVVKRTPKVAFTLNEANAHNLALAMMGEETTFTQAATAVTNEVHVDVKQGDYVMLDKYGPVTAVVVEPSGGGAAFVLGTDYSIKDGQVASIYIIPGGGIADAVDIQVDYTPTAYSAQPKVIGATDTLITGELLFAPDPTLGPKWAARFWKVSIASDSVVGLLQAEAAVAAFDLSGTVLSDAANHPTEPYWKLEQVGKVS